ncbi:MAG: methylated-DNA--[protein]-cysteine S-methyltransferase [Magnetococcales bacterium]|nr:methylated-DNA--[protein]-cysteine S-methyltransferase [Magnetococcales bacterium]
MTPTENAPITTPIGCFWLHTHEQTIVALSAKPPVTAVDMGLHALMQTWLDHYFAGQSVTADLLPLAPEGSAFRVRVWTALQTIGWGQVQSYGEVAKRLNSSPRAVGGAVAANPIPIVIPCHRVIGTNRALRGYSAMGGVESKRFLLALEGGNF